MKTKFYLVITLAVALACGLLIFLPENKPLHLAQKENEEREHDEDAVPARYVESRYRYEYDMLKDPATGRIPEGIFEKERQFAKKLPSRAGARELNLNSYIPAGPNNIGGRTRAVAYDKRYNGTSNRVIISGCVSGGIMRSTDGGNTWKRASFDSGQYSHNLTALAQDPRPGFEDNWYAGTGEFIGNTASEIGAPFLGYGLWKSVDNGATWIKLNPGTGNDPRDFDHPLDFIYDIEVNPTNGDVYVCSWVLLLKSSNAGSTFKSVFQNSTTYANSLNGQMDVSITKAGRIYLAVNGGATDFSKRGVWYSDTGETGSWTRVAGGSVLGVDSVAGWRANSFNLVSAGSDVYEGKRILIQMAPSNDNVGYVFYQNGLSSDGATPKPEADFFRFDVTGGNSFTWSNRSSNMPDFPGQNASGTDPLTVQGGYDMELAVKPDNANTVFVGGTNLYRSTDGFATTNNTAWIAGYKTDFSYSSYLNSHADIHKLAFSPTDFNRAICANDGGIQETTNISAATVSWKMLPNYQTLQCYNVAIDPTAGRNNFASGSQDNGVRFRDKTGVFGTAPADSNNHVLLYSADGAYVGISQENSGSQYLFESIQYGKLYRVRLLPSYQSPVEVTPNGLTSGGTQDEFGEFVTNFRIETENTETIYYVNFNRLFRTNSASTVTKSSWTELTGVSKAVNSTNGTDVAIRGLGFSRGPYTTSHALYIGTTNGKIFRLDDPKNAPSATTPVNITPAGLSGNVQDIAVNPNNDDEVLAIVSNYNVVNIWWTKNGKSATPTWKKAEGNLTLPSIRSCAIVVKKDASNQPVTEYYVGTSIGLYSVQNLGTLLDAGQSPTWQREGGNVLDYPVVTSLAYRPADNVLLVGTHGNGMYYSFLGQPNFNPNVNTGVDPVTNDTRFIRNVYMNADQGFTFQTGSLIGVGKISVQLFNMKGQLMYKAEQGYQSGSIPTQRLAKGVYVINISSEDNKYRHVQKVVKR